MINPPLVSIITPCYNAASVISQTIESVLNQSYTNWELLICDDCSTDNTCDIINEYMSKDSRIHLYSTPHNTGHPIMPRNISLANANGNVIAFLDADDIWLPDMLKTNVEFLTSNGYDIVFSEYEKFDWDGTRNNRVIHYRSEVTYRDMLRICSVPACITTIATKEAVGSTKFLDVPIEDYAFWLEIFRKGYVAHNTHTVQGLYRQSPKTRSGNKLSQFFKHWYILRRVEKINLVSACYYQMYYAFAGLIRYLK